MHAVLRAACAAVALGASVPCIASSLEGLTLEQALKQLKRSGLPILYSSDLVKPSMRVAEEPHAPDPRTALREIVAPHGLAVTEGPRGYLMLVRARRPQSGAVPVSAASAAPVLPSGDLAEVIVTASHYELARSPEASLTAFSAADLELMPDIGEDPMRAVMRLPGAASSDISAKTNLRGGETDEALILFDGVRLFNPFHFKDFHSVFSTIDPGVIDMVRIYTGGFPAAYGDRMSGVIDIEPLTPKEHTYREVAVSLFNASALATGLFDEGDGDWLVAVRRGHPDLVLDLTDPSFGDPRYHDLHGRLRLHLTDGLAASANVLVFDDQLVVSDSDAEEVARARYRDQYYWLRFDYAASSDVAGSLVIARTNLESRRSGAADQPGISRGSLEDRRDFGIDSLQSEWSWRFSERALAQFGAEWRHARGDYEYRDDVELDLLFVTPGATTDVVRERAFEVRPRGSQYGAYANLRVEPLDPLALDVGLRWDEETLSPGGSHRVSPRLGMRYRFDARTEARASWGRYCQGQAINELQVSDGITSFHPSQCSDHLVGSLEYQHPDGPALRLEAYRKDYRELRPRFENLLNTSVLLPELKPDRIRLAPQRALAQGAELTVRRAGPAPLGWWASYTWAQVEDDEGLIEARRTWDQTHQVSAGFSWQTDRWQLSLAGLYHSGRPTTAVTLAEGDPVPLAIAGARNSLTLDSYFSVDARVARRFAFDSAGVLTVFLEVRNLTNRRNVCCTEYELGDEGDTELFELEHVTYPPLFPSFGFLWQF